MSDLRDAVSTLYARALHESGSRDGAAKARELGYDSEAQACYADPAQASFGCGNPLAFEDVRPGQSVLDLGSGAGLDLLVAADRVGPSGRVIGIDMTDAMIETAREHAARLGRSQIEVRKGYIEDLPVEARSVDWVISNCVINLSQDKARVCSEIARVLVPGGHFSISDIVVEELPEWLRGPVEAHAACIAGAIPEAEYLALFRTAGLEEVRVAERKIYDIEGLRSLVASEIDAFDIPEALLAAALEQVQGKVASIRVTGRAPQPETAGDE